MSQSDSYFSVAIDLIPTQIPLAYDLFVNSSSLKEREKFVRIYPRGESLQVDDIGRIKKKFHQVYVPETQRRDYLKSLSTSDQFTDGEKTTVMKNTAIQYLGKIFDTSKEFSTEVLTETIKGCRDSVEGMVDVLKDYNVKRLQDMIGSLSFHDFYTFDHSINVSMYCILLYRSLNPQASRKQLVEAGLGGLLHDLGKIKIPTHIINNPGKLSDEEFATIKQHPDYGLELLDSTDVNREEIDLELVARVIHEHHENFNGTGYPHGLQGEEIHILARICSIADFFDAITTKRSYHEAKTTEEAINLMATTKGKKIDPELFDFFAQHLKTFVRAGQSHFTVPDSFDPCQPQNELPLEEISKKKVDEDFGKVELRPIPSPSKKKAS